MYQIIDKLASIASWALLVASMAGVFDGVLLQCSGTAGVFFGTDTGFGMGSQLFIPVLVPALHMLIVFRLELFAIGSHVLPGGEIGHSSGMDRSTGAMRSGHGSRSAEGESSERAVVGEHADRLKYFMLRMMLGVGFFGGRVGVLKRR